MAVSSAPDTDALHRVLDLIRWGASEFARAGLEFGHGSDSALDESFHLVCVALNLPFDIADRYLDSAVTASERERVLELLQARISTRKPAAYLTGRAWFCGLEFEVNEHVLVPRSPIAEMIVRGFSPWLNAEPTQVLDLCAGSGCIGIAIADRFPDAAVDLVEIDEQAVRVCERNIAKHGLEHCVRSIRSDLYAALEGNCYELIVSNPPYVPTADWEQLAAEYQHEPKLGLEAGSDGMDLVQRLVEQAPDYLSDEGLLVCEVGAYMDEFEARFPSLAVTWVDFENGGEGVFVVSRDDLIRGLA